MRSLHSPGIFLVLLAAACTDSSGPPRGDPGIRVVSGGSGSDTVLAVRDEPLVVEVRDSTGRPVRGEIVRFETPPRVDEPDATRRHLYVCKESSNCTWIESNGNWHISLGADAVTDANGRARMLVQHGTVAGAGTVAVTARDLGYTVTASYTTLPGAIARITASTLDTAVYVGASFDPNARAVDRFGNARPEAVALEALTPSVAAVSAGRVSAVAEGRARVVLRAGALVDTLFVSVPPAGRLLVARPATDAAGKYELVLISTDGSASRRVALTPGSVAYTLPNPSWSPDGRRVLFLEGQTTHGRQWTFAADTATGARAAVVDTAAFAWVNDVSYSRAGDALYFYGNGSAGTGIYRANGDGSGAALLIAAAHSPAVSPDGTRLAYFPFNGLGFVLRELATGRTTDLAPTAWPVFWSAAGDQVGYFSSGSAIGLSVVRPDGTGHRVVTTGFYNASWSPDGAWMAAVPPIGGAHGDGVWLVRVADGTLLRVPGTGGAKQVSWRP